MSNFKLTTLTTKGNDLLLKVLLGQCSLEFTRIVIGNGEPDTEDYRTITSVVSEKMESTIVDKKILGDGFCSITGRFSNENLNELVMVKEIGVYAIDPELGEILYSYTTANGNANYFAPSETTVLVEEYSLLAYINVLTEEQILWNIVAVTNAKEVEFDNTDTTIDYTDVDGALRQLDSRSKPSNLLCSIVHNLNKYPQVILLEVLQGAGNFGAGEQLDDSGISAFIRTRYLGKNELSIFVSDELTYGEVNLSKINNNEYVINFDDTEKSLHIILE